MASPANDRPSVLLVNPPIFDFTAYDFWLRPYGMLRVAGCLGPQTVNRLKRLARVLNSRLDEHAPPKPGFDLRGF